MARKVAPINAFKTFVIMPFGNNNEYEGGIEESDYVYKEIVQPAIRLAVGNSIPEPTILREVDRNQPGSINTTLIKELAQVDVVIADITGRNPNVFLELGIRYALRNKVTIIIAQKGTIVPFDIKGYRYIEYHRFKPWEARAKICAYIKEGLSDKTQTDSVVFDVFSSMSVFIPGVVESHGQEPPEVRDTMRWSEYEKRITWIYDLLTPAIAEGRLKPSALIGISNGGLVVADLVGRALFRGTTVPILGLWANRQSSEYFENPYNDALIGKLGHAANKPISLILVDDHFGQGVTSLQATQYLHKKLGDDLKILFIPLVSRRIQYIGRVEEFFPYEYKDTSGEKVFKISKEQFLAQLDTQAKYFPYLSKEISTGG